MKRAYLICLFQCLATTFLLSQSNPAPLLNQSVKVVPPVGTSQADPKAQAMILDSYGKLPLRFEANHGQVDGQVKFLSRTSAYSLFLTADEAVLALRGSAAKKAAPKGASGFGGAAVSLKRYPDTNPNLMNPNPATPQSMTGGVLRMKLRHANPAAKVTGTDELAGTSNYFIGNDPTKWRTNVPTFAKVKYEGIYSGIDLVYYGNQRQLEYDFIVAAGADPGLIAFDVRGAKRIRRDAHGDLVLRMETSEDEIRWHAPVVYQEKDGVRQLVAARYAITDGNRVRFELARYDRSRSLYIDPLIYSTYLGGSKGDFGTSIAVDSAGNAYVTGATASTDFPTMNPLQPANDGALYNTQDVFVAKINPAGSALMYSTYLGGDEDDTGFGITVDSGGNAYITGYTFSFDFPTTPGAFQTVCNGPCYQEADAFVTKINPEGSALVYSTYLGGVGHDIGYHIAVDSVGDAYVVGFTLSTDFPTRNPLQPANGGGYDVFVSKINPAGSALVYSTYLGGSGDDGGYGIAVDSADNAYLTGSTLSTDFPTKNPLQAAYGGISDAFVAKINAAGSALVYSTYLGGAAADSGNGIALDGAGNAYVTGLTESTNFPSTPGAFQTTCGGGDQACRYGDAFVTKINAAGSALVYSTFLGGNSEDDGRSIALDSAGNAYVTGDTSSGNFPIRGDLQKGNRRRDAFVSKLNPTGSALVYSIFLGGSSDDYGVGIAVDSADNAYVTGWSYSTDFPITTGAFQTVCNGGSNCLYGDAIVAKIFIPAVTTTTLSSSLNPSSYGQAVTFTAVVTSGLGAPPDGETVTFRKGTTVLGTGTLSGGSASLTTSALPVGTDYIKAVYGGDSSYGGSTSNTVSQVANKATTTTTLASSRNPSNVGQSVTFTASVTPQFSGTVKGTVTFYDGATALKTVALSGGVAKFTTSTLASGSHNITATYNGSTSFIASSASLTQTVN
jgi:hypothetical protein